MSPAAVTVAAIQPVSSLLVVHLTNAYTLLKVALLKTVSKDSGTQHRVRQDLLPSVSPGSDLG